jgi:hypothetical protein
MRHMRWGYRQLMECPVHYIAIISEEAQREAAQRRQR